MKIISFAWTTPALLARQKTVTRRAWTEHYASGFKAGEQLQAWSASPRFKGLWIGTIELVQSPSFQPMKLMPDSDYEAEGFAFMAAHGVRLNGELPTRAWFEQWRHGGPMWVVRFKVIELRAHWNQITKRIEIE